MRRDVFLAAAAALLTAACSQRTVTITVRRASVGEPMTDTYLIAGPYKEYFPAMPAEAAFSYKGDQPAELTIVYLFNGEKQTWTSPQFDPGAVGEVLVEIDGKTLPAASAFRYKAKR